MINVRSLGLLLACFALSPLVQATLGSQPEELSNDSSAAGDAKEVPDQTVTVDPLTLNPLQVALLKWGTYSGVSFAVQNAPANVAFDGANLWVTNLGANTVTKLRVSDGAVLGNFPVGGSRPKGIAFDGVNIWIGNVGSDNVTRLRASDGVLLGIVSNVRGGDSLVCDGANIWVADLDRSQVTKVRTRDVTVQGPFSAGGPAACLAFDGENIWVANRGLDRLTKLRASDGTKVDTVFLDRFAQPYAVAFDGANIWAVGGFGSVFKVRASDGAILGSPSIGGGEPQGVAFDGANIWVTQFSRNTVTKLRVSDGQVLGTFPVGSGPLGIAFDGANIWVANQSGNTVSKL